MISKTISKGKKPIKGLCDRRLNKEHLDFDALSL